MQPIYVYVHASPHLLYAFNRCIISVALSQPVVASGHTIKQTCLSTSECQSVSSCSDQAHHYYNLFNLYNLQEMK